MSTFIYVFDEIERDKLLGLKYTLVKSNDEKHIYVFLNEGNQVFSEQNLKFVLSDTISL